MSYNILEKRWAVYLICCGTLTRPAVNRIKTLYYFLGNAKGPKTQYGDPDLYGNALHASKMMSSDSVPFYGVRL